MIWIWVQRLQHLLLWCFLCATKTSVAKLVRAPYRLGIMHPPLRLTLYSTSACHLCELAKSLLEALPPGVIRWREVEICEDETLLARYGTRIPVIRLEDHNAELGWPFDAAQLMDFIAGKPPVAIK